MRVEDGEVELIDFGAFVKKSRQHLFMICFLSVRLIVPIPNIEIFFYYWPKKIPNTP
jgi:hypothetical protein